jgi:hypothetical protein
MQYNTLLLSLVLLSLITISSASPNGGELLTETFEKRNQCPCSFAIANFSEGSVRGVATFSQDEKGDTEVAGIFSRGFNDTNAKYGFQIVDSCHNVLFDLSEGLNLQPDGFGATKSFRHKFNNNIDCDDNGFLTKKFHYSKRHCSSKLRKRDPNEARVTQDDQGIAYTDLEK